MSATSRMLRNGTISTALKAFLDGIVVVLAYALALALRFEARIPQDSLVWLVLASPLIAATYVSANVLFRIYRRAWQYASYRDALALAGAVWAGTLLLFAANALLPYRHIPLSVNLIAGALTFLALGAVKFMPRLSGGLYTIAQETVEGNSRLARLSRPGGYLKPRAGSQRLLIVGAGNTGEWLARELLQHRIWNYRPVCFVDDTPAKQRTRIHGIPVRGTRDDIPSLVEKYAIETIALAIPSAGGAAVRDILTICQSTEAKVQIVPGVPEMMAGKVNSASLREVTPSDLLGREPVEIDSSECSRTLAGKRVLITGAGGSIGSELARQVLSFAPASLHLLDNNEEGLYNLQLELCPPDGSNEVRIWVADVANQERIKRIFTEARPQLVFHVAAYKQVPLMEGHPEEAFRVNVGGTLNVCQAAREHGTEKVVFISSDKAANPVCVVGFTKRIGELLVEALGEGSSTVFCGVRFGNVFASRGSAVPTFWRQIELGGPVTVTDPEVTRFFMTIPEAVSLIIQAITFAEQGQILILDMGEEIKIADLARKLIRLRGLRPDQDVQIVYTGLRPGEKLREELVGRGEKMTPTRHPKVLRVEGGAGIAGRDLIAEIVAVAGRPPATPAEMTDSLRRLAEGRVAPSAIGPRAGHRG